uniref:Ectonucleotide pyrophosphatase/phosphodiesterase family member 4 n=1 Tax=Aceria tosichella TaxID=561515 RepID=A0A6G1SD29_9ACAR
MITSTVIAQQLPILILISFDGFRHDYLSPTLTPNLFDLSKQATLGHMESMYITKTFPNHFSIATGLYEDEHEIINNKMYDPRLNDTFTPANTATEWWNYRGTNMPIWTANQVIAEELGQKRYSASMMYPGSSTPYRDTLPTHLKEYAKNADWTENVDTVINWLTDPERPANFVSMYFDEPDTVAHNYGPWGQETLDAVRRVDSAAGYLVKRLRDVGLAPRTNIIFVSDHGMAEVRNVVYMSDFIDTSSFILQGNSPDWSVFVKPEKRHLKAKIFQDLLAASKKYHYRVYKRADIPPELHYSKSVRIGDFFILAREKYDLFLERPQVVKPLPQVWGNHGWKPSNRDMRPLFMAYGPSFRKDYNHLSVFPNIDLFPLMVFLLGLPSASLPNNGSLARIVDVIDVTHFEEGDETIKFLQNQISESLTSSATGYLLLFNSPLAQLNLAVFLLINLITCISSLNKRTISLQ